MAAPSSGWRRPTVALVALLVLAAAVHLLIADRLLLEGAAGKQTHTAMIARNLYRGRASLLRPSVDDMGKPGYFVKEVPLLPGLAALAYGLSGGVDERIGRMLSVAGWLGGIPLLVAILRRALPPGAAATAAAWCVVSPLAFVYARAFMSDATMVAASLAAFLALVRFREEPSGLRASVSAAAAGIALLLKPHAVFWIGPAACVLLVARPAGAPRRPAPRWLAVQVLALAIGVAVAASWYVHAALVHRRYPAPGATGLQGWFVAAALLEPGFYTELLRQTVFMVFTPLGLAVAILGVALDRRRLHLVEVALLAWGAGVVLQCFVFDTRLFDEAARGTEYYQLAMVPVAALLVGRGVEEIARRAGAARAAAVRVGILSLLTIGAAVQIRAALTLPERYARILPDCEIVRRETTARDELFVLADRGGTILYYCDRSGTTFVPARAVSHVFAHEDNVVGVRRIADAMDRAAYVYVPFPELLGDDSRWLAMFDDNFERIETPGSDLRLYRKGIAAR